MSISDQYRARDLVSIAPLYAAGPWHLDRSGLTIRCAGWRSQPSKKVICSVRPHLHSPEAITEAKATARIIAAAPDLRDVCAFFSVIERAGKVVFRIVGVEIAAVDDGTTEAMVLRQFGENRRAAIAKSVGGGR